MGDNIAIYISDIPAHMMRRFAEERLLSTLADGSGPKDVFDETDCVGGRSRFFQIVRTYEAFTGKPVRINAIFLAKRPPRCAVAEDEGDPFLPEQRFDFLQSLDMLYERGRQARPLDADGIERVLGESAVHPYVRIVALRALGRIGRPTSIALLERIVRSSSEMMPIRREARRQLVAWSGRRTFGFERALAALKDLPEIGARSEGAKTAARKQVSSEVLFRQGAALAERLDVLADLAADEQRLLEIAEIFFRLPVQTLGDDRARYDHFLLQHSLLDHLAMLTMTERRDEAYQLIVRAFSNGWWCEDERALAVEVGWPRPRARRGEENRNFCFRFARMTPLAISSRLYDVGMMLAGGLSFSGGPMTKQFQWFVQYGDFGNGWFPAGSQVPEDVRNECREANERFLEESYRVRELAMEEEE